MSNCPQAAVVGGGIAGLIAAAELARGGAKVTLFERAADLGGRAASRAVDGFTFNQGAHALYKAGAFAAALAALGIVYAGGPPPIRQPAALWGERRRTLPIDVLSIAAAAPLSFGDRARLLALFASLAKLDLAPWRGRAFGEYGAGFSPKLRATISALARLSTYAAAPEGLDAAAVLAQLRLAGRGVVYVDGGWGGLVAGLAAAARAAGAELRVGAPVERVKRSPAGWRVGDVEADAVVLATPLPVSAALAPENAGLAEAAGTATPVRAIALDYALRRLPRPDTFALGIDAPVYVSVHSASARLAPDGGALLHALRYLAPGDAADAARVDSLRALVARLQPGFEAEVVQSARLLGMPVACDSPLPARGGRMAPVALGEGLYLAGDGVGEGAMLSDAAAKSAREAAALILARGVRAAA